MSGHEYVYVLNSKNKLIRKNLIQKKRIALGLTRAQLAKKIKELGYDVSLVNLGFIEKNEIRLTYKMQFRISKIIHGDLFEKLQDGVDYEIYKGGLS
jgi:hypothetical protein